MVDYFELGTIRPPSEAHSLLIRATVNCPWNKCKFCHIYKGQKFGYRSVADIKQDITAAKAIRDQIAEISWKSGNGGNLRQAAAGVYSTAPNEAYRNVALWLYAGGENCFLQDSNTLIMRTNEQVEVIRYLKHNFPGISRVTSYGRSNTAAKKTPEELRELHDAGLSRLHIGLETGYDPLLEYMDKGVTAGVHIAGGRKVVESGISLSEYVILGLGGKEKWRKNAIETARVLNEIDPHFIRVRTLAINSQMPLSEMIEDGEFVRATDEQIVEEERLLLEHLECHSNFVSDHITNLLQEIEGKLPEDKGRMLAAIDRFRSLSAEERLYFRVGRRVGIFTGLDELNDLQKRQAVEQVIKHLSPGSNGVDEKTIHRLTSRFI